MVMELGNSGGRRPWRQQIREVKNTPGEIAVVVAAIGILAAAGYTGLTQTRVQDRVSTQADVNEVTSSERNTKVAQTPGPTTTNLGDIGITHEPKSQNEGQGNAGGSQYNSGSSRGNGQSPQDSRNGSSPDRRSPGRPAVPAPVKPGSGGGSDSNAPVIRPTDPAPEPDTDPVSPTPTFEPTGDVTVVPTPTPTPTETDDSTEGPSPEKPGDGVGGPKPDPSSTEPVKPKPDPEEPGPVKPKPQPDPEPEKPGPVKPDPVKPEPEKPGPVKPKPEPEKPAPVVPDPAPGPGADDAAPTPDSPASPTPGDKHRVGGGAQAEPATSVD